MKLSLEVEKEVRKRVRLIMFIAILVIIMFSIVALYNNFLYHEAIKQGAKSVVTVMEMVVACQQLSNVTSEQVKEQYIKTFILNNSETK